MDEALVRKYPELENEHFWWRIRREVLGQLVERKNLGPSARILDVGCGAGVFAAELSERYQDVVGVESEFAERHRDRTSLTFHHGDYLELAPELGHFDLVLALDVVEHFEKEANVLSALYRNTRAGGSAIITVPAYRWLWSKHDDENRHYRRYNRSRLRSALESAGFEIETIGHLFLGLILPKALIALLDRFIGSSSTTMRPPGTVNAIAYAYFRVESKLALSRRALLPAGTSVVAIARRLGPA